MNTKIRIQNEGYTLLETMLALGAVVAIVASGFWVYSIAAERLRITNAQKQLAAIYKGMSKVQLMAFNVDEAKSMLLKSKSLPSNMVIANNDELVNPWSGKVTITSHNGSDIYYDVSYYNVPSSSCIDLVNKARIFYSMVGSASSILNNRAKISDLIAFCSNISKNEPIVFSNFVEGDILFAASVSVSSSIAVSTRISTSKAVSTSASISGSISASRSNSISSSISASNSASLSRSVSASKLISASTSISRSIATSKSNSSSVSASNSISLSRSASASKLVSVSTSVSRSIAVSKSVSSSISTSKSVFSSRSVSASLSNSRSVSTRISLSNSLAVSAANSIDPILSRNSLFGVIDGGYDGISREAFIKTNDGECYVEAYEYKLPDNLWQTLPYANKRTIGSVLGNPNHLLTGSWSDRGRVCAQTADVCTADESYASAYAKNAFTIPRNLTTSSLIVKLTKLFKNNRNSIISEFNRLNGLRNGTAPRLVWKCDNQENIIFLSKGRVVYQINGEEKRF
ncbi:hypothetical protein CJG84_24450 [Salmonella enterica]|nr:hypothetical protein [Salmonella enterica]